MDQINEWLQDKNRDYQTGVQLYAASPSARNRILQGLKRGYSDKNTCTLISELRKLKNSSKPVTIPKPKQDPVIEKIIKTASVRDQQEKETLIQKSAQTHFSKVRLGDLPKELRPRYKRLSDLWYQMCELKFILNDIPAKNTTQALQVIIKLEALEQEREMIWKELDHWKEFRTMLPVQTGEDFTKLTAQQLYLKKVNLGNYIHKKEKRIESWKQDMGKEPDKQERLKIQQQINRTLKSIHEHELNIKKIEERL